MTSSSVLARVRLVMANVHEFPCEPGYRLHHGERVADIAASICETEGIANEPLILRLGAIMHDIGKNACPKGVSHAANGAKIVETHFADLLAPEEMSGICEIISHHCDRPKSKWFDSRVKAIAVKPHILAVQDADVLDHFGPSGIWLSLHWAAAKNSSPEETARYWFDSPQSNDWRAESRQSLNFESSRVTLEKHIMMMDAFYKTWMKQ